MQRYESWTTVCLLQFKIELFMVLLLTLSNPALQGQGGEKSISQQPSVNTGIWEGILSPVHLLSLVSYHIEQLNFCLKKNYIPTLKLTLPFCAHREPETVVVPPFEATGLNDDIWADVHNEMAEVAEMLNSVKKNKSEEQESSSTAKRHTSAGR